ncbi:hypothetical protein CCH79_00000410 [Gambusia affinis]|uniref:Uncharacterized protein n=1 Tax=Gambusia affinis TaxID=33528 RepID=A0A315VUX1_GAMAF|nr:hypothetical protein CCH79_00000410 [Gambusia affinis]
MGALWSSHEDLASVGQVQEPHPILAFWVGSVLGQQNSRGVEGSGVWWGPGSQNTRPETQRMFPQEEQPRQGEVKYCHTVCLDSGIDYRRLDRPEAGKLYHLTGEPGAEAYLDALFEELALRQKSVTGSRVLTVLGRDVTLQKTCGSIADCTFEELCGKPTGASDYLEMARIFDTVFIRHVPKLTLTLKDQARRFTTLIDNFYDHKVRVVLLAAAPLEQLFVHSGGEDERDRQLLDDLGLSDEAAQRLTLFTAEEEIFAFQRTVSRLREMQTEAYWMEGDRSSSSRDMSISEVAAEIKKFLRRYYCPSRDEVILVQHSSLALRALIAMII